MTNISSEKSSTIQPLNIENLPFMLSSFGGLATFYLNCLLASHFYPLDSGILERETVS